MGGELLSALLRCPSHRPSRRDGGFDRISEQISQQLCVAIKRKTCRFVGGIDHNAQLAHVALSIVRHANGRFLNSVEYGVCSPPSRCLVACLLALAPWPPLLDALLVVVALQPSSSFNRLLRPLPQSAFLIGTRSFGSLARALALSLGRTVSA